MAISGLSPSPRVLAQSRTVPGAPSPSKVMLACLRRAHEGLFNSGSMAEAPGQYDSLAMPAAAATTTSSESSCSRPTRVGPELLSAVHASTRAARALVLASGAVVHTMAEGKNR